MSLRPGSRLGPYEVLSLLGQGGMGQVYRARDSRLGRDVAIKVLLADRATDREAVARFEREARAVAALSHPNILSVFDVGVDAGMLFIVGELLEGETLRARLSRGPLPWRKAIDVAAAMASGLAAAHDKGIVHRDLKPENVFLTADGQVKILDFGLARLDPRRDSGQATTHTVETDPGSVLGTTGYMSPEQVRGEAVDVRSDLFSLGSVLYEMVTGARAFARGTGVETMAAILNAEPPDVTGSGKNVPPDLGLAIHHCLEKSPRERYQSASDLAFALKALASASGSAAAVVPVRRRMPAMAVALVIIAAAGAIVVAVLATWHWSSGSTPPAPALKTSLITNSGRDSEPSISPDGKFVAYVSEENGKQSIWMHQFATHTDVQLVPQSDLQYHRPVFSPDGAYVYYNVTNKAQLSSAIYQVASIGGEPRLFLRNVTDGPAFSPDGSALVFSRETASIGETSLFVAHADGTAERKLHSLSNGFATSAEWSPAGDAILVASMSGKSDMGLSVISVKDGTERVLGARRWKFIDYPAWRAATGILLVGAAEGGSQIWHVDPASGDARQITHDVGRFSSISVSADGDTVVADQGRRDAAIWVGTPGDAAGWKRITTGAGLADGIRGLSWTTNGRLLYSAPGTGGGQIWVMAPDGSGRRQLTSGSGDYGFPRMSPDGRFIACTSRGSGRSTLSRMDADGDHLTVIATEDFLGAAAWSPDSRALVYMASDKAGLRVKRVSVDGGAAVDVSDRLINAPSVSPDGLSLAALVEGEHQQLHPAIVPFPAGGTPRLLEAGPGFQAAQGVRWLPDGQALAVVRQARGVDNVWRLPVNGGTPTQMTSFTSDEIGHCAWTLDGRTWACARGHAIVELVRITGFRALIGAK